MLNCVCVVCSLWGFWVSPWERGWSSIPNEEQLSLSYSERAGRVLIILHILFLLPFILRSDKFCVTFCLTQLQPTSHFSKLNLFFVPTQWCTTESVPTETLASRRNVINTDDSFVAVRKTCSSLSLRISQQVRMLAFTLLKEINRNATRCSRWCRITHLIWKGWIGLTTPTTAQTIPLRRNCAFVLVEVPGAVTCVWNDS